MDVKWRELSIENTCRQKFRETVDAVHTQLERFNYGKFQLIKKLMETHWDHPTLNRVMAGADDLEESEGKFMYQSVIPEVVAIFCTIQQTVFFHSHFRTYILIKILYIHV